jgi:hypothetical protein
MHDPLSIIAEVLIEFSAALIPRRQPYRTWFFLFIALIIASCVGIALLAPAR